MSDILENHIVQSKNILPNVDFYSASLLHALNVPTLMFTPLFASARAVGWIAHAIEQLDNNVLLRPRLKYIGELGLTYSPIEERH
jgi:citrate synthase